MSSYRGRRAASIENPALRVTILEEGGHIAEITDKATGVNPLWTPDWPSIEPSSYDRAAHGVYGDGVDAPLLAGLMGHNVCLDIFGGPSPEEAAAGLPVHGEVSTARFTIDSSSSSSLTMRATLPETHLRFERRIDLVDRFVRVREQVENLTAADRPIAWTQHVTLGPPFLKKGRTELRASAARSKVFEGTFGPADYLAPGAEFDWPRAPRPDGGSADLRVFTDAPASSGYTAHQMDPAHDHAFFVAYSPESRIAVGYVWRRPDFPWLGIWEENHARPGAPWNGRALTRGLEFGVSPFPETRRQMIDRGPTFGTPGYRWIPARSTVEVEYWATVRTADAIPEQLDWPA